MNVYSYAYSLYKFINIYMNIYTFNFKYVNILNMYININNKM